MELLKELEALFDSLKYLKDTNYAIGVDKEWAEWVRENHLGKSSAYHHSAGLLEVIINQYKETDNE